MITNVKRATCICTGLVLLTAATPRNSRWFKLDQLQDGTVPYWDRDTVKVRSSRFIDGWVKFVPPKKGAVRYELERLTIDCDDRTVAVERTIKYMADGSTMELPGSAAASRRRTASARA